MVGFAAVLGVAVVSHDYIEPLMGWGCHDNAYQGGVNKGFQDVTACRAFCDAKATCWAWELWWDTGRDCATDQGECWIYDKCADDKPFMQRQYCNRIDFRAAVLTPTWKVSCGEDIANCCEADADCFRTMNYPNKYDKNSFCVASYPTGDHLLGEGETRDDKDPITLYTVNTAVPYSGKFDPFSEPAGPAQHLTFTTNGKGEDPGVEICIVTPPTSAPILPSAVLPPPSLTPSSSPSLVPSSSPTNTPTDHPSPQPTASPSVSPTMSPTTSPSLSPSVSPTGHPSPQPTASPSLSPSLSPTGHPSPQPTASPSVSPTAIPTVSPSLSPSVSPTGHPSPQPTTSPSLSPTAFPTVSPSLSPSVSPTGHPSPQPTTSPSLSPTAFPTTSPSLSPSVSPTGHPSPQPTASPSLSPSLSPTGHPSPQPTASPSVSPTAIPTVSPSL
eukprot:Hpha_TRINITY_DN15555_c0_g4::TRINITY_DN15555_c0_g4_i3::g.108866::m.108866